MLRFWDPSLKFKVQIPIENEVAASLDYNDIIAEFAAIKARKVIF